MRGKVSMQVTPLALEGLKLIRPSAHADARGFFLESYESESYRAHGIDVPFVQDNLSFSRKGVLRGMHFQRHPPQAKLVTVVFGDIYDVVVDMRIASPTFGKWISVRLSDQSYEQLFIPVGFAHGFCVLSDVAYVTYKVSTPYDSKEKRGFRFDDPEVGIEWPIKNPIVSEFDRMAPLLAEVVV